MKPFQRSLAGVIGHPISHSLSPEIFYFLSQALNSPLKYEKYEVSAEDLAKFLKTSFSFGNNFVGFNVTLPHKETLVSQVDQLSPEVVLIGALNVIQSMPGGTTKGYNTDVLGIQQTLREKAFAPQDRGSRNSRALIVGAGGAARAVAAALGAQEISFVGITNRTFSHAQRLCDNFSKHYPKTKFQSIGWETAVLGRSTEIIPENSFDLYINTTPMGMKGVPDHGCFKKILSLAPPTALAFDLIYRPLETSFLKAALTRKMSVVGGLDMLIWQALATWEIWFGELSNKASLKTELASHLSTILLKEGLV